MTFGDEILHQVLGEIISSKFDLLLGRRTYEVFTRYWPHHGDNPNGKAFNRAKKYVASRSLAQLDREKSHRLDRDVVAQVRPLKASKGPARHIRGSGELLQTLIAADLVDEYRLWVAPVVLGKGQRLFGSGVPPRTLTLVETRRTSTGVLLNIYRPVGPLSQGTDQSEVPSAAELVRRKKLAAESSEA